jgi:hypothetical protein
MVSNLPVKHILISNLSSVELLLVCLYLSPLDRMLVFLCCVVFCTWYILVDIDIPSCLDLFLVALFRYRFRSDSHESSLPLDFDVSYLFDMEYVMGCTSFRM